MMCLHMLSVNLCSSIMCNSYHLLTIRGVCVNVNGIQWKYWVECLLFLCLNAAVVLYFICSGFTKIYLQFMFLLFFVTEKIYW